MKIISGQPAWATHCDQCDKPAQVMVLFDKCEQSIICRECIERAIAMFKERDLP